MAKTWRNGAAEGADGADQVAVESLPWIETESIYCAIRSRLLNEGLVLRVAGSHVYASQIARTLLTGTESISAPLPCFLLMVSEVFKLSSYISKTLYKPCIITVTLLPFPL